MRTRGRAGVSRRIVMALATLTSFAALAACTAANPEPTFVEPPKPPAKLIFSHKADEVDASPGMPVTVSVVDGTLETVVLSSNLGEVSGTFNADRTQWMSAEDLQFAKTYTLEVTGIGADGVAVAETRSFTTVSVAQGYYWGVSFSTGGNKHYSVPLDGGTFGVGQTIIARFDDVVDRKVAESHLKVTTVPPLEGSWSWINEREVHWRPKPRGDKIYWPAGTKVTVEAKILGVKLTSPSGGRVLYGRENRTATFTIGDERIAKVDDKTKLMTVFVNGVQVPIVNGRGCSSATAQGCTTDANGNVIQNAIRVSLGQNRIYTDISGRKNNWVTQSGIHVVTEKENPVVMTGGGPCPSGIPGSPDCDPEYYREVIPHAVRLTDSGVYVHSASWSVNAQGNTNVSHGCVNVHPKDAIWFYELFDRGDVVEIYNTGRMNESWNGNTDWNKSWAEWIQGSALYNAPPAQ